MKTTVTFKSFVNTFDDMHRTNFSTAGLRVLFDYIEAVEDDCGDEFELDVIALCCDYAEDTAQAIAASYNVDGCVIEYLEEEGYLVGVTDQGTIVYRQH